jgi:carbon monoxide dehydrogenase subunit G
MQFTGDRDFGQSPADLWTKLSDARFLVECIPDTTATGQPEKNRAQCQVRPGVSFVRGSLDVNLEVAEAVEATSVRFVIASKGIGSAADVETTLAFGPHEGGTRVHWEAEVKRLGGLLKAVPAGLIRGAAQKVIADIWESVSKKLNDKS